MQNNNDIKLNQFTKGLNLDLLPSFLDENMLTHMRNGTLFSFDSSNVTAQNEQSNRLICTLPYPIIGCEKLPDGTWCLFLTDNEQSEIGVFNEVTFKYETKLNAAWLNFNQSNLITGASKELQNGDYVITWCDGRRNPDRRLNLSKASKATPDNIRLAKFITPPVVDIKQSNAGVLPNGSYQAAIRYSANNKAFGEVYSLTLPIPIWSEMDNTGAIEVSVQNVDNDFDYYELIIIQTHKETTTAKVVGTYPKATSKIHISSFDRAEYLPLELKDLVIQNQPYVASDLISSNNQYLFRVGVETIPELNYQLQAFDIKSEYVVHEYPEDYHSYGENVGNYRDEVYAYYIQWLHKTGAWSSAFTIPGREAIGNELSLASGTDVYEGHVKQCDEETVPHFLVYNTAEEMVPVTSDETICEGREVGYGKMAYYQSTETYPDNVYQYGEYANTNIRLHKFPDESKCPRYSIRDGKAYINILGLRLSNIPHPKKADGTPDTDWVGWRVIRPDRNGNKSIISRGMVSNVRSYIDKLGNQDKEILYTNYPYNDLRPDSYISSTQTVFKNGSEQNFNPLTTVYYNKWNYYSPHSNFSRYGLAEELKVETEEIAEVRGQFSEVFNHPKQRLLSLFSFWVAFVLGAIEALMVISGKGTGRSETDLEIDASITGGVKTTHKFQQDYPLNSVEDLIGLDLPGYIASRIAAGDFKGIGTAIKTVLTSLASLGLKGLTFTFFGIQMANQVLDVIEKFMGYTNYTLQYNSHAFFNSQSKVNLGDKRRYITKYQYLESGLSTINNNVLNNFGKHNSVYVELNSDLGKFKNVDNSRQTLTEFGIGDNITKEVSSQAVMYYVTNKRKIVNQYGRIESTSNFLLTHNNYFEAIPKDKFTTYSTPTIFGGDCYIVRDRIQTKHRFFTQDQSQPYPIPSKDGEEFNYLLYRNIGYPRFWANFFKYDFSEFISAKVINFTKFSRTVTSRHNLDNKGKDDTNKFRVDNAYFYTSCNGVIDYFVECDFNLNFREKPDNDTFFYSNKFSNLSEIFRSDRLLKPEQFKYNTSLSKQANEIYAQPQPTDYNPTVYDKQYKYSRNRLIYSLPSFQEYKYDNWEYFLSGNQYEFPKSEFGNFISLLRVDRERLMFLFDRASPYITLGQNQLELKDGTEVEIGSGGLFAQPPRELIYTEQHYGSSQSRFASCATVAGTFYVGERQGRFYNFQGNAPKDLTQNGLETWSKHYFPIQLTKYFPDFKDQDNPVCGVGYLTSYDATINMLYISKKDYIPLDDKVKDIIYDKEISQFTYKGSKILLSDSNYFSNLSFTLSFSTSLNSFVSFHDWYPDWSIPIENHFITAKGNKLYLHNNNPTSYCNYYGIQYPFEVEYAISNKFKVETFSSLEYYLECYKYREDGINKVHIKDENFDRLIVYNSEQISGILNLNKRTNNPFTDILFPKPTPLGFDILYDKVENKIRVNNFFDITKDRSKEYPLLLTQPNGYNTIINDVAIDPLKSPFERKMFRHYNMKIALSKQNPSDIKMILMLSLNKEILSNR